jgi:hypothetical protein
MVFTTSPQIKSQNFDVFCNFNNLDQNDPQKIYTLEQVKSSDDIPAIKFLGIHLDQDLSFKYHVKMISKKLSKALFALRCAKNVLETSSLKAIYYALFHSHLNYATLIWSSATENLLKEIQVKQKAAIRIIAKCKYNEHTEPYFKMLDILPLNDLIFYSRAQFMFLYARNHTPRLLCDTWTKNENRGGMQLRNQSEFKIPFSRISLVERMPYITLPSTWSNRILDGIRTSPNIYIFSSNLKSLLIDRLQDNIRCTRLFCPTCANI